MRDGHAFAGNVLEVARALEKEVMVIGRVGVEIGPPRFDHDFTQQTGVGELVQRVVDRRQRHLHFGLGCLHMQLLGRDMPVDLVEQQARKSQPLPGRTKTCLLQAVQCMLEGACSSHGLHMVAVGA
jgi:hypothetical protein